MSSEEERIIELIKVLDDEKGRMASAWALGKIGESALPALGEAFEQTNDVNKKVAVIKAMGMMGKKSLPKLIEILLKKEGYWVQSAILRAFKNIGKEAEEVIPLLMNEVIKNIDDPEVYRKTISTLEKLSLDTMKVNEVVLELLRTEQQDAVYRIIKKNPHLLNISPEIIVSLIKMKKIKSMKVFYKQLRKKGDKDTAQAIANLLEEEDDEIKLRAIYALRVMYGKNTSAIPFLERAMLLKENSSIKFAIAYTLLMIEGINGAALKELNRMAEEGLLKENQKWKLEKQINNFQKRKRK